MAVTDAPFSIWSPDGTEPNKLKNLLRTMALSIHAAFVSVSPSGLISAYAGATAPTGWLLCDGSAVSRTTYAALFAAIGTTYGSGDGSTTFNVPNLKGRAPFGRDGGQDSLDTLGEASGSSTHTHHEGSLAAAIGAVSNDTNSIGYQASDARPDGRGPYSTGAYSITGAGKPGNQSFNHYTRVYGTTSSASSLPPLLVVNFIIKT
jgi:microcystin-dependent protein